MKKLPGRPVRQDKDNSKVASSEKGTKPGETRKTYIVNIDIADKIEKIAERRGVSIKGVVHDALSFAVAKHEQLYGKL